MGGTHQGSFCSSTPEVGTQSSAGDCFPAPGQEEAGKLLAASSSSPQPHGTGFSVPGRGQGTAITLLHRQRGPQTPPLCILSPRDTTTDVQGLFI